MGNATSSQKTQRQKQEQDPGISPIIQAKSLLSNGDKEGAFAVLMEAAESGDVMACYDAGFMMIQGIGCEKDYTGGLELMKKGKELEEKTEEQSWKSDGSATGLIRPQEMNFFGQF